MSRAHVHTWIRNSYTSPQALQHIYNQNAHSRLRSLSHRHTHSHMCSYARRLKLQSSMWLTGFVLQATMLYSCLSHISTQFQPLEPSSTKLLLRKCAQPVHNYSWSFSELDSLPKRSTCIPILLVMQYDSITHESPIFRPLKVHARLAYAHTTTGEASLHVKPPNQSQSFETFKWHHIHSSTTLQALTTTIGMPVAYLSGIIIAFWAVLILPAPSTVSLCARLSFLTLASISKRLPMHSNLTSSSSYPRSEVPWQFQLDSSISGHNTFLLWSVGPSPPFYIPLLVYILSTDKTSYLPIAIPSSYKTLYLVTIKRKIDKFSPLI